MKAYKQLFYFIIIINMIYCDELTRNACYNQESLDQAPSMSQY